MRIIFSRKGFDSAAGGGPSPIIDGKPISLPIPSSGHSRTTWDDLGLGSHVAAASRGRWAGSDACHHDPMFLDDGTCLFGQSGAAQTHLANQGVGVGDAFVFFGLFREPGERPHHRIFGYLRVERMIDLAAAGPADVARLAGLGHPHALGMHGSNDVIYCGPGRPAGHAHDGLRLTAPDAMPSLWRMPLWLRRGGLSYHDAPERWLRGRFLRAVSRGQEFVADVGNRSVPKAWLDEVIRLVHN